MTFDACTGAPLPGAGAVTPLLIDLTQPITNRLRRGAYNNWLDLLRYFQHRLTKDLKPVNEAPQAFWRGVPPAPDGRIFDCHALTTECLMSWAFDFTKPGGLVSYLLVVSADPRTVEGKLPPAVARALMRVANAQGRADWLQESYAQTPAFSSAATQLAALPSDDLALDDQRLLLRNAIALWRPRCVLDVFPLNLRCIPALRRALGIELPHLVEVAADIYQREFGHEPGSAARLGPSEPADPLARAIARSLDANQIPVIRPHLVSIGREVRMARGRSLALTPLAASDTAAIDQAVDAALAESASPLDVVVVIEPASASRPYRLRSRPDGEARSVTFANFESMLIAIENYQVGNLSWEDLSNPT